MALEKHPVTVDEACERIRVVLRNDCIGLHPKDLARRCYGVNRVARKFVLPAIFRMRRTGELRTTPGGRVVLVRPTNQHT